ncbi:phage tail fiber protein [Pseudomonas guariconensis]|uniref:phage tail fiber domain-containing protein n=1 Tax=Pseudomonas guariconensis TaxID=1288410 RepID=UPI002B05D3CD|nr:phage tail fiber protein [Pseudomonas guariconensis]
MAITTVYTYPLDGSSRTFNIPFEYLARRFVVLTLLGIDRKELTLIEDYRFISKTAVQTNKAWRPSDGYDSVEIRRNTSVTDRLVDFTDGSILRASDLNASQIQTLHVAEEARNMVADTIAVNNDGDLDARGRRLVNLANALEDRDAVTLSQQKEWAASALNQADRARNEADRASARATASASSASAAKSSEDRSKASEVNAKSSEDKSKVSEVNAKSSEDRSKVSEVNAKSSEDKSKVSEVNAKASEGSAASSASSAATSASTVLQNIASYGANPVGTIVIGVKPSLAGYLLLDGSKFDKTSYPELFEYLGTDVLPDWRDVYLKGAGAAAVGSKALGQLPSHTHTTPAHTHTGSTASAGAHTHTVSGSTSTAGSHQHRNTVASAGGNSSPSTAYPYVGYSTTYTSTSLNASAGAHTHTISGTAASNGAHTHTVTIAAGGGGVTGATGNGDTVEVDRVHVHYLIKAKGAPVSDLAGLVASLQERIAALEAA